MVFLQGIMPGNDLGLTIVVLTILIRIAFLPLSLKTLKSQILLKEINPQIEEIKKKFKNDITAQSAAIIKLYKENNINPLAGCLPLLIQLPILIALYQVFAKGILAENFNLLYSFVSPPETLNQVFLGFLDITSKSRFLALIAGCLQFLQSKQAMTNHLGSSLNQNKEIASINKQMLYFFPIMIIIIGWNLPVGLVLYWITTTLVSFAEQNYINKKKYERNK
jgi:YidC/Oxa1 family membrane protein insertase